MCGRGLNFALTQYHTAILCVLYCVLCVMSSPDGAVHTSWSTNNTRLDKVSEEAGTHPIGRTFTRRECLLTVESYVTLLTVHLKTGR